MKNTSHQFTETELVKLADWVLNELKLSTKTVNILDFASGKIPLEIQSKLEFLELIFS